MSLAQRLRYWLAGSVPRPQPPSLSPLLETHDLQVRVGQGATGRVLVRDLSLSVRPGEFWCVLGPNGVGKTQLLNTLAGARPPASGEVRIAGVALADWSLAELACLRGTRRKRFTMHLPRRCWMSCCKVGTRTCPAGIGKA